MKISTNSYKAFGLISFFIALLALFNWGLTNNTSELPSQLINQPVPQFQVADLLDENQLLSQDIFKDKISLLNVWASWCAACYSEHPYWNEFVKNTEYQLVGLNYNDKKEKALKFLTTQGNPYHNVLFDFNGRLGIEFGVYGAPETFLIGPNGKVRYRHVGVVSSEVFESKFAPLIKKIKQGF